MVVRSGILRHTLPVACTTVAVVVNQDVKAFLPRQDAADKHLPVYAEYLALYFNIHQHNILPLVTKQSTTVESVETAQLNNILIPVPPLDVQRDLVAQMQIARAARADKLREADEALAGINAFLLDALGLTPPPTVAHTIHAIRLKDVFAFPVKRCDYDFHSLRFRNLRAAITKGNYNAVEVKSVCLSLTTGFAAGGDDQADDAASGIPHVRPMNIMPFGEFTLHNSKYVPTDAVQPNDYLQQGEVLFNNTNSTQWVGKSTVFESDVPCACSNHITRLTLDTAQANPQFIAELFNALRVYGLFGLLATNFNNQAGVNTNTLAELVVPLPPLAMQEALASGIGKRREKARQLKLDATQDWAAAKVEFERALLGEGA